MQALPAPEDVQGLENRNFQAQAQYQGQFNQQWLANPDSDPINGQNKPSLNVNTTFDNPYLPEKIKNRKSIGRHITKGNFDEINGGPDIEAAQIIDENPAIYSIDIEENEFDKFSKWSDKDFILVRRISGPDTVEPRQLLCQAHTIKLDGEDKHFKHHVNISQEDNN